MEGHLHGRGRRGSIQGLSSFELFLPKRALAQRQTLYNKVRSKPTIPTVAHCRNLLGYVRSVCGSFDASLAETSFCPPVHDRFPDFLVLVLSDPELHHHRKDIKIGQF